MCDMIIDEILLLSPTDMGRIPEPVLSCECQGLGMLEALLNRGFGWDGCVKRYTHIVCRNEYCFRPALRISNMPDNLSVYKSKLSIFGYDWVYIGDGMVLCTSFIFGNSLNDGYNIQKPAEIKERLHSWLWRKLEEEHQ